MTVSLRQTLPCGRVPEELVAHAAEGTAPPLGSHAASCEYCQAAIREVSQLWVPVRQWARRDVPLPEGFVATVIVRVKRIVHSPRHLVSMTNRGVTTVSSWALGIIAGAAAHQTPGVAQVTGTPPGLRRQAAARYGADGIHIGVDEAAVSVTLALSARSDQRLPKLADAVRRNIIDAMASQANIVVSTVDVTVDDIEEPGSG